MSWALFRPERSVTVGVVVNIHPCIEGCDELLVANSLSGVLADPEMTTDVGIRL